MAVDSGIVEIYLNNKLISSNNVTGVAISKSITVDESKSFYNISVIYKGINIQILQIQLYWEYLHFL